MRTPKEIATVPFKPTNRDALPTPSDTLAAVAELYESQKPDANLFTKFEKRLIDPPIHDQRYALFTFIPSSGATPDSDNVYGMVKIRGSYRTLEEADERAEFLIRESDSMHSILTGFVGAPMPLLSTKKVKDLNQSYGAALKEIKLSDKVDDVVSSSISSKRKDEKVIQKEMESREAELKRDVQKEPEDRETIEKYIESRVKRSQLIVTLNDSKKRMKEIAAHIRDAQKTIDDLDRDFPTFKDDYSAMYKVAREQAGVPDDDDTYIKYLDLDFNVENLLKFLDYIE